MRLSTKFILFCVLLVTGHLAIEAQTVERLVLINASSNQEIQDMALSGDSINIDTYPMLNFRAVTNPEPLATGEKCSFQLTYPGGAVYNHSEGTAVYACFGDLSGDYKDWESGYDSPPSIQMGEYTLKVTPGSGAPQTWAFTIYNEDNGGGGGEEPIDTINITEGEVLIQGEQKQWHNIIFNLGGPVCNETGNPNPFLDYRFQVEFTKGDTSLNVPGYFAADGNAYQTGATGGNVWRAHFCPPATGTWNYTVSFLEGSDIAVGDPASGTPLTALDGISGTIEVGETDKMGRDLRSKGRLSYVGEHHLRFAGTGEWFMKAGADAPENFLAYDDFDNTPDVGGRRKSWSPHIADWKSGDPTWHSDKGKGIIGAVNYLASKGMNVFSFLTMNINGDDKNVFPYTTNSNFGQFDCSKLDQWEIVFEHAGTKGMYLHFKTQETENEMLLDNGNTGKYRKLYYRELIARFGHHLALNWNLGEENSDQSDAQRKAMAAYIAANDPYKNHIVIHTYPNAQESIYRPMLGSNSELTGASIQTGWQNVYTESLQWVNESAAAGKKWVVANDEQGSASIGVPEDAYTGSPNKDEIRKNTLWGNMMAGGAGVEYYFGYDRPQSDLNCEDYRSRDKSWDFAKLALDFFNLYVPYWEMKPDNSFTSTGWGLMKNGEVYVIYLKNGGTPAVTLPAGNYTIHWYNPKEGGPLLKRTTNEITGGSAVSAGASPDGNDWVVLIREENFSHPGNGAELVACGEALVYNSYTDFPDFNIPGFVPAYLDNGNQVLAVNAVNYKDEYAAAQATFDGEYGIYDITLTTLTETDGESSYKLKINGNLIGEFQNPPTTTDYEPATISWPTVEISNGDLIQLEFNTHTNGLIPEGESTAYSRGRWKSLSFQPMCSSQECSDADAFTEKDAYVVFEAEDALVLNSNWSIQTGNNSLGTGYIQYDGPNTMSAESEANRIEYKVQINTPGSYQFLWRTRRGIDAPSFDAENDTWLRINASDFYGMKSGSKIDCNDHFIKVWVQKDDFIFECFGEHGGTNGFTIYADFDTPGEYTIEVSGRSQGHVIDRIALFMADKKAIATDPDTPASELGCGGNGGGVIQEPIAVEGMYLSYNKLTMEYTDFYTLKAHVIPENADDPRVTWLSHDMGKVYVSDDGRLFAQQLGEVKIVARSVDGNFRDTCMVNVIINKTKYPLDKSRMTVIYADSEDTEKGGGVKERALDGDYDTFWHTQWFSAQPPLPHELHIDLDTMSQIDVIDYWPRQDIWGPNGAIGEYEFYMSDDGIEWGEAIAKGAFNWANHPTQEDYKEKRRIYLDSAAHGRYLRLLALTEDQNIPEKPFTAVAELDLYHYYIPYVPVDTTTIDTTTIDTTSIHDYRLAEINVYPNPANASLHIDSNTPFNALTLIHLDGRVLKQIDLDESYQSIINITDIDNGAYILLIKNKGQIIRHTGFIKQNL